MLRDPSLNPPPLDPPADEGAPNRDAEDEDGIEVVVDELYLPEVSVPVLQQAVAGTLSELGHRSAGVTVVITSDAAVTELNRQYRGLDEPTDVLSFSAQEAAEGFVTAPEANAYLGDILIAFPYTQRQAADLGRPLMQELQLLAVHGTLHLLGYDHAGAAGEAEMWALQDRILARLKP